jgi:hypothetical protein
VRLLVPDVTPDVLGLERRRETAKRSLELIQTRTAILAD